MCLIRYANSEYEIGLLFVFRCFPTPHTSVHSNFHGALKRSLSVKVQAVSSSINKVRLFSRLLWHPHGVSDVLRVRVGAAAQLTNVPSSHKTGGENGLEQKCLEVSEPVDMFNFHVKYRS